MILRLLFGWLALVATLAFGQDLLRPEDAFKPSARALDGQSIEVRFEIARGYYLYRDKFRFAAEPAVVQLGTPQLPAGKSKEDETFGRVQVFYREAVIRLPVERLQSGVLPLTLHITSQGCADAGVCYPPRKQSVQLVLPDVPAAAAPLASPSPSGSPPSPNLFPAAGGSSDAGLGAGMEADEAGRIARWLAGARTGWVVAGFFGFGLLLAFTPCMFPMLPILSGIIVGAGRGGETVSRRRAMALSLAYVLGMAAAYAAAGVAAGLSGTLLVAALQNAWVLGAFALLFVVLALSMFGAFSLQLPVALQNRAAGRATRAGSLPGVTLMGALSALVVGPCVAAPLAGALLYIGGTGDAVLGGVALFFLALGMGVPLLLVGVSAGTLLPRAGPWMATINRIFGVFLLASALWIVSPLLPAALQMAGWALLLIVPAIFLRAIDPLPRRASSGQRFGKALGVVMLLLGVAMLAGALAGGGDPLRPLAVFHTAGGSETPALPFERVRSTAELEARLASAGRPVMLDFYADWCVSCKEMERYTFSDARVRERLSGWLLLQADVTANTADDQALLKRFGLFGPPGIVFFDAAGQEVAGVRVVGYQKPEQFLNSLRAARE